MRNIVLVLIAAFSLSLFTCDDGDIITVDLDFGETFKACEGVKDIVFYKTKNDPSESLSLKVTNLTIKEILNVDSGTKKYENEVTLNNNNVLNYRTYSNTTLPTSGLFCNDVPLSDIVITQNREATAGTALIQTVLTEDDNDGIPAELEDLNGNGDLEDDDTDNDGIPNYLDADDDGDNVPTIEENPDPNNDGDFSDAQNTDSNHPTNSDTLPDYLDDDDDGDGIPTRDEENNTQNEDPTDDETGIDANGKPIPDYLNDKVKTEVKASKFRDKIHKIKLTYTVTINISNVNLEIISLDNNEFGILEGNGSDIKLEDVGYKEPKNF